MAEHHFKRRNSGRLNRGRWRRGSAWDSARCPSPPSPPSSLPTHLPCCQKTRRRRETRSACYHDTLRDSREHYGYLRDSTSLYGRCRILRLDTRLRGTAQYERIYEHEPMRNATRQQRHPGLTRTLDVSRVPRNNQSNICFSPFLIRHEQNQESVLLPYYSEINDIKKQTTQNVGFLRDVNINSFTSPKK